MAYNGVMAERRKRRVRKDMGSRRNGRRPQRTEGWGWWCWGYNEKGRRVALGPFSSESEAHVMGASGYPGDFGAHLLRTRNLATAKTILKAKDVQEGKKIDDAMRYTSSELP